MIPRLIYSAEVFYCRSPEEFFFLFSPYMKDIAVMLLSGGESDCSRYCIAGWDPIIILKAKGKSGILWSKNEGMRKFSSFQLIKYIDYLIDKIGHPCEEIPFTGGFLGYVAYEYKNIIEPILPQTAKDDLKLPDFFWIFPSKVAVFDKTKKNTAFFFWDFEKTYSPKIELLNNSFSLNSYEFGKIGSNFTKSSYISAIRRIIRYIRKGDVYQVNLSQRFFAEFHGDPLSLFYKLFISKPAPFYAYINAGDHYIVSTSMERFLYSNGEKIETRPIKGTRPRGRTEKEDKKYKLDLLKDPKDDAELSMIVDLLRNDLGKICKPGTVTVKEHKRIETYSYVHHLVSIIEGELIKKGFSDIIKATFPGGSITGCPKIRAMEIIDELEPNVRHLYTGSIGYVGIGHKLDLSIAIRTLIIKGNFCYYGAGGGIVYDSDPEQEYKETLNKAEVFFDAGRDEKVCVYKWRTS